MTQKEEEFQQLEKAFKLLDITNYEVIEKDKESPDFIVEISGQRIGIRDVRLFIFVPTPQIGGVGGGPGNNSETPPRYGRAACG